MKTHCYGQMGKLQNIVNHSTKNENFLYNRIFPVVIIFLMIFGMANLTLDVLAQSEVKTQIPDEFDFKEKLILSIVENLLTVVAPIVASAVGIAIRWARQHGLRISAEAEEYFVENTRLFVDKQTRFIFRELNKPENLQALRRGEIPTELGKAAFTNVKSELLKELKSDEFTKVARTMINANLDALIENAVTKAKSDQAKRALELIKDLAPKAVDAAMLTIENTQQAKDNRIEIINEATNSIFEFLKKEFLLESEDMVKLFVKAELRNKINPPPGKNVTAK